MASPVFQSSQVRFMFSMTHQFKLTSSWFWKNTGDHSSSRIWLLVSLVQANSEFWSVRWSLFWQTGLACFFRGTTHVMDWDWTEQLSRSRTRTRNHLLAVLWSGSGTWRIIELNFVTWTMLGVWLYLKISYWMFKYATGSPIVFQLLFCSLSSLAEVFTSHNLIVKCSGVGVGVLWVVAKILVVTTTLTILDFFNITHKHTRFWSYNHNVLLFTC